MSYHVTKIWQSSTYQEYSTERLLIHLSFPLTIYLYNQGFQNHMWKLTHIVFKVILELFSNIFFCAGLYYIEETLVLIFEPCYFAPTSFRNLVILFP